MDSRTDEKSSIDPQLIKVESIKNTTKKLQWDNLEECMRLFNLITDLDIDGCDGDTNEIIDLSVNKNRKKNKKRKSAKCDKSNVENLNTHASINDDKFQSYVASKLNDILVKEGFEDYFELHAYKFFIESYRYQIPGIFKNAPHIPRKMIVKARNDILKSKPDASEDEIKLHLTNKFYGCSESFDRESSFLLNQCLRVGSECFIQAKELTLNQGYNII